MATMREVQSNWTEITNRLLHDKGEMLQFLRFSANLYKLPFSNAALVYRDNPNLMYIASASQWNQSGRYVRSGEHGITVFDETPSKNALLFLFDISQTDDPETPVTWRLPQKNRRSGICWEQNTMQAMQLLRNCAAEPWSIIFSTPEFRRKSNPT